MEREEVPPSKAGDFADLLLKDVMFLMRGTIGTAIALALMLAAPAWAAGGYVHEVGGEVSISAGKNPPLPAVKNHAIGSNTLISTGDKSHAVLKFADGQVVALQANTVFNVSEYRFEPKKIEKSNIIFTSLKGGLLFVTGLIGQRNKKSFRLTTPNATIGVRGTEFMAVMVDDVLYGKVISGSISMNNDAGTATFDAGQTIQALSPDTLPLAIPAENLPAGIFSQLEAIQLPRAEPGPIPVAEGISPDSALADGASIIAGGALLSAAAAVTGGAAMSALPPIAPLAATGGAALPSAMIPAVSFGAGVAESTAAASSVASASPVATIASASDAPAAPVAARGSAFKTPSAWYDDTVPPSIKISAGSAVAATPAGKSATGDPSLFGRHNFTPDRVATGEICVFCHTPQGSEEEVAAPLWNRTLSAMSEYKAFSSIGSATAAATGSVSIACLSCHDGTQAPNVVINSPPSYSDIGIYPEGLTPYQVSGAKYLKDHHPVSMLYGGGGMSDNQPSAPVDVLNSFTNADYDAVAVRKLTGVSNATSRDFPFQDAPREAREPGMFNKQDFNKAEHSGSGSSTVWWLESRGSGKGRQKSDFYLYTRTDTVDGIAMNRPYVECSSCHDPHSPNTTFLRIKNEGSTVCMTCHAK